MPFQHRDWFDPGAEIKGITHALETKAWRKEKGKITIRVSEKVIRINTSNYLPKIPIMYVSQHLKIHM